MLNVFLFHSHPVSLHLFYTISVSFSVRCQSSRNIIVFVINGADWCWRWCCCWYWCWCSAWCWHEHAFRSYPIAYLSRSSWDWCAVPCVYAMLALYRAPTTSISPHHRLLSGELGEVVVAKVDGICVEAEVDCGCDDGYGGGEEVSSHHFTVIVLERFIIINISQRID